MPLRGRIPGRKDRRRAVLHRSYHSRGPPPVLPPSLRRRSFGATQSPAPGSVPRRRDPAPPTARPAAPRAGGAGGPNGPDGRNPGPRLRRRRTGDLRPGRRPRYRDRPAARDPSGRQGRRGRAGHGPLGEFRVELRRAAPGGRGAGPGVRRRRRGPDDRSTPSVRSSGRTRAAGRAGCTPPPWTGSAGSSSWGPSSPSTTAGRPGRTSPSPGSTRTEPPTPASATAARS